MADIMMSIGLDPQDAIDSAHDLQLEIKDIFDKTSGKNLGKQFDNVKRQMSSASSAALNLERQMAKLENKKVGYTPIFQKTIQDVERLEKEIENYKKLLLDPTLTPQEITQHTIGLQATEQRLRQTQAYQAQLEAQDKKWVYGKDSEEYERLAARLGDANNRMAMLVSAALELLNAGKENVSTWDKFKQKVLDLKKRIQTILKVANAIVKPFVKATQALGKLGSKMLGLNKASDKHNMSLKKMINQVLKYGLGIRSLFILWRKLRGYTADALKLMATQFEEVDADVSMLMNSFNQMKLSMGTMAQPLMHALAPVLVYIIELITRAATALANFFAILTGQKYIYKAQKANDSYADSIKGVGSAAKEANKELAEYDNLLVIDQPNDGGGGGGGGAADGLTGTFEKTLAESDFAKQLREAIKKGDWEGVGGLFANKLNLITKKFDDWVKNFRPKAVEWAKNFGKILGGFIDEWDADLLGRTVGDTVMGFMDTVATWWENVPWRKLGTKIADAVNGLVDTWEPETVGRFFSGKINAMIDFAAGLVDPESGIHWDQLGSKLGLSLKNLIEDIHWETLGSDLSNLASGILTAISTFIQDSDLGNTIGTAINNFLNGIDFAQVATDLSDCAKSILGALADLIETIDWYEVGKAIADFLTNIDWLGLLVELGKVALALIKGLGKALLGLASNPEALADIGTALIAIFGAKWLWGKITGLFGSNVASAISGGVTSATGGSLMGTVSGALGKFFGTAIGKGFAVAAVAEGAMSITGSIGSVIATAFGDDELAAEYQKLSRGPVKYMVGAVSEGVKAAKEYSETTGRHTLTNAIVDMFTGGPDTIDKANKKVKEISDNVNETYQRAQYSYDVLGLHELVSDEDWEAFKNSCDNYVEKINELQEAAKNGTQGMSDYSSKYTQATKDMTTANEESARGMSDYSSKYKEQAGIVEESTQGMTDYSEKYKNEAAQNIKDGNEAIVTSTETMNNQMSDYSSKYQETIYGMSDYADKYKTDNADKMAEANTEITTSTEEAVYGMTDYSDKYKESIYGMTDYAEKYKNEAPASIDEGNKDIEQSFYTMNSNVPPSVKEAMDKAASDMVHAYDDVPDSIGGMAGNAYNSLNTPFLDTKSAFETRVDEINTAFEPLPNDLGATSATALENIKANMPCEAVAGHFGAVKDSIQEPFNELPTFFSDTFRESWDEAESAFSSGNTTFNNFNSKLSEGMTNVVNGLLGGLNNAISSPLQSIQNIIEKFKNVKIGTSSLFTNIPSFSNIPKIPMLAEGAVIPPNREFMAMLGDQTSGVNIETPLETMIQAFKTALSDMGGSSNNQNIVLQLDGRTVAQCVWDEEDKRYKQTGRR